MNKKKGLIFGGIFVVVLVALVLITVLLSQEKEGDGHHSRLFVKFMESGIVPDVLSSPPPGKLYATFKNNRTVDLGFELTPEEAKEMPVEISWDSCSEEGASFTLAFIDPDAPSRLYPTRGQFRHWFIINIPGCDVDKGETRSSYRGPGPRPGTGLHRYVLLAYKQKTAKLPLEEGFPGEDVPDRLRWNVEKFAEEYNLTLVAGNFFQAQTLSDTQKKFMEAGIVPDLISQAPGGNVRANFGGVAVELGTELTVEATSEMPEISTWTDCDQEGVMKDNHTLIMADPDATSREDPKYRSWRHWLVINIPGCDIASGQTIAPYKGPSPPAGTGLHRYVLLALRQPAKISLPDGQFGAENRGSWDVQKFVEDYKLYAVSGNYFQVQRA